MNKLLSCRYNMDTGQNWTGCCTISLWSMHSLCWVGRLSTTCHLAVTTADWKID